MRVTYRDRMVGLVRLRPPELPLADRESTWLAGAVAAACGAWVFSSRMRDLFQQGRPLAELEDGAYGLSASWMVDASGYSSHYVGTIAMSALAFCVVYLASRMLTAPGRPGRVALRDRHSAAQLAAFATFLLVLSTLRRHDGHFQHGALMLAVALLAWWRRPFLHRAGQSQLASWPTACSAALVAPLAAPFVLGLFDGRGAVYHVPTHLVLSGVMLVLLAFWARRAEGAGAERRAVAALAVLCWLPLAAVVGNELHYRYSTISPRLLAALLQLLVVAAAAVAVQQTQRLALTAREWWAGVGLTGTITTLALGKWHRHILEMPKPDLFHRGEEILPAQQWLQFGKVPLFDLRPVHTFSDLLIELLYGLANGSSGSAFDPLVWRAWVPVVFLVVLLYLLLSRLLNPLAAATMVGVLPITTLVTPYDGMILWIPLVLIWTRSRRRNSDATADRRSALALTTAWLAIAAWRVDFGLASAAALGGVLLLLAWNRRTTPLRIALALRGAAAPLAAAFLTLGVLAMISERGPFEAVRRFAQSYLMRSATRTRPQLIEAFDLWAAVQYHLLPLLGLVVVVWFATRALSRNRLHVSQCVIAFLAAYCLVLSTRSLERHTLIAGFRPYLFLLLLCLLPVLLRPWRRGAPVLAAVLLLFGFRLMFTVPPLHGRTSVTKAVHLVPPTDGAPWFRWRRWTPDEPRVRTGTQRYDRLVEFLDRNLAAGETFYDFSDSPMLYALSRRPFPTYLIPTLEVTGEHAQDALIGDLEELRSEERLPFVILRNFRGSANFDLLPEVTSPRVAEYLFRHYQHRTVIGGWDIWAEPSRKIRWPEMKYPVRRRRSPERLLVWPIEGGPDADGYRWRAGAVDPHIARLIRWADAPPVEDHQAWALEFTLRASVDGSFAVFWRFGDQSWSAERRFDAPVRAGRTVSYSFPIPREEDGQPITGVRFDPPENSRFNVDDFRVVGVDTFGYRPEVPQRLQLRKLPWIWANIEPRTRDAERTDAWPLIHQPQELAGPDDCLTLQIPREVDPARANYLRLRLRPEGDSSRRGVVRVSLSTRGEGPCCGFDFILHRPVRALQSPEEYLVRLSPLWQWQADEVETMVLRASAPVTVETVEVLQLQGLSAPGIAAGFDSDG